MNRYPLIAYLDSDITAKIRGLQEQLRDLTGSRASLRDWDPHISIGSEALLMPHEVGEYVESLKSATKSIRSPSVSISGFGFMDNWSGANLPGNTPYGVYLKVKVTPELQALANAVESVSRCHRLYYKRPDPYLPHITLAFRDLGQAGFQKALRSYKSKSFEESTRLTSYSLAQLTPSGNNREAYRIHLKAE